jgi:hypothetical protein
MTILTIVEQVAMVMQFCQRSPVISTDNFGNQFQKRMSAVRAVPLGVRRDRTRKHHVHDLLTFSTISILQRIMSSKSSSP